MTGHAARAASSGSPSATPGSGSPRRTSRGSSRSSSRSGAPAVAGQGVRSRPAVRPPARRSLGGDLLLVSVPGEGSTFTSSCRWPGRRCPRLHRSGRSATRERALAGVRPGVRRHPRQALRASPAGCAATATPCSRRRPEARRWRSPPRAPIDLAVLDVHLPDMSGLDVCAGIKADPRTSSTPVLHVSAIAVEPEDRSAGLDHGADAYMVDPIQPREMLSTVRSLLRSSVARRDAERLASRLDRLVLGQHAHQRRAQPGPRGDRRRRGDRPDARHRVRGAARRGRHWRRGGTHQRRQRHHRGHGLGRADLGAAARAGRPGRGHAADEPWTSILSGSYDGPWTVVPVAGSDGVNGLVAVPAHAEATDEDRMLLRRVRRDRRGRAGQPAGVRRGAPHRAHAAAQPAARRACRRCRRCGVAARYKASGDQVEVGGDFFDTFRTDDGRSVVVIGDVQGHSLEAAIVMAELRYSLRAFVLDGHPALDALSRLNADPAAQPPGDDRDRVHAGLPRRRRATSRSRTPGTSRRWSSATAPPPTSIRPGRCWASRARQATAARSPG